MGVIQIFDMTSLGSLSVDYIGEVAPGCGDAFHGAYAWSIPSCLIANAAARKAGHKGGRQGIPDIESLRFFLVEQGMFRNGLLTVEFEIMAQS